MIILDYESPQKKAVSHIRQAVTRPVQRRILLKMLDDYNNGFGNDIDVSHPPNRVIIVSDIAVNKLFQPDNISAALFHSAGGVLLRTSLSYKWRDRKHLLCHLNFWRLWEIVVMQSGWVILNVRQFNLYFNGGSCGYIALIRPDFYKLIYTSDSGPCRLATLRPDKLSNADIAYGVFKDIGNMLRKQLTKEAWNDRLATSEFTRLLTNNQRSYFQYQIKYLDRLITCRRPPLEILKLILEMNALAVGYSSPLPRSFDVSKFQHRRSLLLQQMRIYVHFSCNGNYLENIFDFCNVDYL